MAQSLDSAQSSGILGIADAIQGIAPLHADYATAPIGEGFTWQECLNPIPEGQWYLVVFRSRRKETADLDLLTSADDRAFAEAGTTPGLLHYFRGQLNERRECLSFCLWENQEQAQAAAARPLHQSAATLVNEMYHSYRLERYWLYKDAMEPALRFERLHNDPIPEQLRADLADAGS